MLLDLDNFKQVNDVHGHDAGDAVLQHVAVRIRKAIGDRASFGARLGGDEFAVLLWETLDGADVAAFAAELQDILALPHVYRGETLVARSSISLGFYSVAFSSASEMFVATEKALMSHKHSDEVGIACISTDDGLSLAS
ncbi:GGDEF domain-containing protein [Hyphomonas sp.]|uniref:GGDEF domain-containing protein n=1 Tax=Hyphomonas sp. TaxID=87 RepID=UPI003564A8C5